MKLVCSFCKKVQGYKQPFNDHRETHGICTDCYEWYIRQEKFDKISDYLNTFDIPVTIVGDTGRVIALNKEAGYIFEKNPDEAIGLLGGEVMECEYARLPEGCGQTAHCAACTIRKLVLETLEFKHGKEKEVSLTKENEVQTMTVLTEYIDGAISIQFKNY